MADFWNLLAHEAEQGTTVTDVQIIARATAEAAGRSLTFEENRDIATLYGYARRIDNAASAFQAAGPDAAITPDLIAIPPWARDQQVMNTTPLYHITFEFTYLDQAGNQQTDFRTSAQPMTLPDTVSGVNDIVQTDAEAMAAKYEVELIGVNVIGIQAV